MTKPKRMAECHPDRPYYARGLCRQCYNHEYHRENREDIHDRKLKYYEENHEQILERNCRWREENREDIRKRSRKHYKEHREEECKQHRIYYKKNRGRILTARRKYYERNREQEREWNRKWREENREYGYKWSLENKYGITIEEYDELLELQHNGCAICGITPEENGRRLCVDHDHKTGEVRGLLCHSCNSMLGFAQDNIIVLSEAISYLDSYQKS